MAIVKDYKKEIKIIEKPVTQEDSQDNWVALQDTKIELKPKELYYPDQDNGKKYVYSMFTVDDDTELILVDSSDNKIECKPDGIETSDEDTVDKLDIFGDDSCIACYPLDNDANDLSGDHNGQWKDSDDNDIDGIYEDAKFGKGAKFDGKSKISTSSNIDISDDVTISMWLKPTFSGELPTPICSDTDNTNFQVTLNDGDDYKYKVYIDDNEYQFDYNSDEDKFSHIMFIRKGSDLLFYINNELKQTISDVGTSDFNIATLGGRGSDHNRDFNGIIDQVRIFNKALSDDEIDTIYNESLTKYKIDISSQDLDEAPKLVTYKPNITKTNLILNQDSEISQIEFDTLDNSKIYTRNITVDSDDDDKFYVNVANKQDIVILEDKAITKSNAEEVTDGTSDTLDILGDDSCIAAYTFDGNADDLSDNYNGQWKDKDGNDIDGVYEDGKFGKCMYSEDEGKYIQFGTSLAKDVFDGKNVITFSFWIKFKDYDNVNGRIIRINKTSDSDNGIYIMKNRIGSGGGDSDITGSEIPNKLDNHIWYHIVGISDGDNGSKIYVNNELKGQDSTKFYNINSDNEFVIGYDGSYTHTPLWIDQVRIFNKALNEDEINVLYNEGVAKFKLSKDNVGISNIPEKALVVKNIKLNDFVKTFDKDKTEIYLPDAIPDNSVALFDEEEVTVTETNQLEDTIVDEKDPFGDGSEVAFYKLDGNADDEHGDYDGTWKDSDDNNIDGTYEDGRFGKGASFDGNSYINIPDLNIDSTNTPLSISLWFKQTNNDTYRGLITDLDSEGKNGNYEISLTDSNIFRISYGVSDNGSVSGTKTFTDTLYLHHLYVKYEDNKIYIYIDNSLFEIITATNDPDLTSSRVGMIGKRYPNGQYLNGIIDQVRIFNRALTDKEVQRLYYEDKKLIELKYDELDNVPVKLEVPRPVKASKPIDLTWDKDNSIFNMSLTNVDKLNTRNLQRTLVLPEKIEEVTKITSEVYVEG